MAAELNAKFAGQRPLFIRVLNGAFFFAAELMKRITVECEMRLREGGQLPRYRFHRKGGPN